MRDSITGAWLYGIVIVFMAFFIAFIAITVNYSNAYRLNTDLITIVEEYNGVHQKTLTKMDGKIKQKGYLAKGSCGPRAGQSLRNNESFIGVTDGKASAKSGIYQFCVTRQGISTDDFRDRSPAGRNVEGKYYYNVTVFFGFDLPLFGNVFTFRVTGSTTGIAEALITKDDIFNENNYEKYK